MTERHYYRLYVKRRNRKGVSPGSTRFVGTSTIRLMTDATAKKLETPTKVWQPKSKNVLVKG